MTTTNNTQASISIPSNTNLIVIKTLLFRMGCNLPRYETPLLEVQVCVPKEEFGTATLYQCKDGTVRPNSYGVFVRTRFWNRYSELLPIYSRVSLTKYVKMLSVFNYIFVRSVKGTCGKTLDEASIFMKGYMACFRNL